MVWFMRLAVLAPFLLAASLLAAFSSHADTGTDSTRQSALLACALIFFLNCFWLTPRINQARDDKQTKVFKTLHWLSVSFNVVQLIVFIWLLIPVERSQ